MLILVYFYKNSKLKFTSFLFCPKFIALGDSFLFQWLNYSFWYKNASSLLKIILFLTDPTNQPLGSREAIGHMESIYICEFVKNVIICISCIVSQKISNGQLAKNIELALFCPILHSLEQTQCKGITI